MGMRTVGKFIIEVKIDDTTEFTDDDESTLSEFVESEVDTLKDAIMNEMELDAGDLEVSIQAQC